MDIKNIIFDFDGVIMDSLNLKRKAFGFIFKDYDSHFIDQILKYHDENGGISRYDKIQFFYQTILKKEITPDKIQEYANKFSEYTLQELKNESYFITTTHQFIKKYHNQYRMSIASGADEKDLKVILQAHQMTDCFDSILGTSQDDPKSLDKANLVSLLIEKFHYKKEETILIGDAVQDFQASQTNGIQFVGFNNEKLRTMTSFYLEDYKDLEK